MAHLAGAVRAAGLYFSNVYFDLSASDYFAPAAATNPLLHTWSLGVEEQFYHSWPVLLVIVAGKSQRWNRVRWVLLSVAVASLTCSILATHASTLVCLLRAASAWLGVCSGRIAGSGRGRRQLRVAASSAAVLCGWAGTALIIVCAMSLSGGAEFPGWRALLPCGRYGGRPILRQSGAGQWGRRLLRMKALQIIGARSYGWYLWHWPALVFAGVVAPNLGVGGSIGVAVGSFALADVTYRLVERPVRESRWLRLTRACHFVARLACRLRWSPAPGH